MENICLGSSIHGAARGIAVAEWIYDPARPPTDAPIRARILNQTLFPQRSFGLASLVDDDGRAVVYTCQAPEQGGMPEQYGPCHAAKVDLDRVADPTAYSTWTGQDFTGTVSRATYCISALCGRSPGPARSSGGGSGAGR